ncbi:chemotaxis protein CheD [Pseudodesulfovibrio sp. JC047]|uniref:chemotaxis protein CheD n=1 Tax=Pseudodesulfovibrio sp. JC047 TaxID=2683199 RepID=UPI0013D20F05|nr:chemotaxis protein CheD [Pseudodesulfovibrio sp. JC047]NDV20121.1 chemotaxis protein CheD [Pseudodesulfovibrio sp. JC047]
MKGLGQGLPKVFLQTGDCFFGVQPTLVSTVLGSCLAVTLHSPKRHIGTICHAFLPDSLQDGRHSSAEPQICRFVDTALQNMLETMDKVGIPRRELVIKMFGGGSGMVTCKPQSGGFNIGKRNIDMARRLLKFARLPIQVEDVGGSLGRKLMFHTQTGEVWVKKLRKSECPSDTFGNAGSKF